MPSARKQDQAFVWIKSVEIGAVYTRVNFYFQPPGEGWICLDKSFHLLVSGTEDKKFMIAAEHIPLCPKMKKVGLVPGYLNFDVLFPRLEKGIERVDLIEKKRNGLNFYGVQINNGKQPPLPDSLDTRKEEDFTAFFTKAVHPPDSLEGIWTINLTAKLYNQTKLVNNHYRKEQLTIAIIKAGESYKIYKTDGAPYGMTFKPAAGGRTIFFRKYFREVDQEVSGYVRALKTRSFELEIELPKRLSHYELIPDYMPGDRIIQVYKFYNKLTFPVVPNNK